MIPIFNEQQQVIAVLIQEKQVEALSKPKDDLQSMPFALIEHIVEPNLQPIPVVSDLLVESIILTNHDNKVIYTNPAGYRFISELSGLESFDQIALDKDLYLLQEVYAEGDDIFFLEITFDRKSFIVKKFQSAIKMTK